jgi:hypothetical protein
MDCHARRMLLQSVVDEAGGMTIHSIEPQDHHIEQVVYETNQYHALKFAIGGFIASRRQFAVAFEQDGTAVVSLPSIGARNPANPQPTDPTTIALEKAA